MADVTATAEPVRLTLKSPSSQFKDLEIEASLSWSIRQLKTHVSKTHPAKPTCDEQKLVYLGQLLQDHNTLKTVLRQTEMQSSWTVHLVIAERCLQRSVSAPAAYTSPAASGTTTPLNRNVSADPTMSSGLRNRHNASMSPHSPPQYQQHSPYHMSPEQAAAYQMYAAAAASNYATPPASPEGYNPYMYYYYSGYSPEMARQAQAYSQYMQEMYHTPPATPGVLPQAPLGADAPAGGERFAQAGVGAAPIAADGAGRNPNGFNVVSALALIGKLALFVWMFGQHTDSTRFALLCGVAVLIFLFQSGMVRWPRRRREVNRPEPNPNIGDGNANGNNNGNGVDGANDVPDTDEQASADAQETTMTPAPDAPRPSLFSEVRDVVVGFVQSLVPGVHDVAAEA